MIATSPLAFAPEEVASLPLEEWGEIASALDGPVRQRGRVTWRGGDQDWIEVGVWECDAGRFRAAFAGRGEFFHPVTGRLTCVGDDGVTFDAGPGSTCTIPPQWTGEWRVHEPVRKVMVEFKTG